MKMLDDYLEEISFSTVMTGFVLARMAYDSFQKYGSKIARQCNDLEGPLRTSCRMTYKLKGLNKYRDLLKKALSKCSVDKDPNKCRKKIKNKIYDIEDKINLLGAKLQQSRKSR